MSRWFRRDPSAGPVRLMLAAMVTALLVLLAGQARADSLQEEFGEADAAYSMKKYDQAIAGYERIIKTHGYSPAVLYNLGNSYFHTDQWGKAILNYERALLLSPDDPDIKANLQAAQQRAGIETAEPKWWQQVLDWMTPNQWAWLATTLLFLWAALALVYWFAPGPVAVKWWRLAICLVLAAFGLTAACAGMAAMKRHYAVVVAKDAKVLQSPWAKAKEVASLPEGQRIAVDKIDKQYQQYVRVRYDKRQLGWVSRSEVEAVQPGLWTTPQEE